MNATPAWMKALSQTAVQDPPKHESQGEPPVESPAETGFRPRPVQSLAEAGLTPEMIDAIIFKYLHMVGSAAGAKIAGTLALPHTIVVERLADLKQHQLLGYIGAASMGDFTYTLTDAGRERARKYLEESFYVGTAPVPLKTYIEAIKAQSITLERPDEQTLREAFSDLLINDAMFATLGPAINSGRGMFLYGFPGNGKTSIAERITRCFGSAIYIPRTLHVDGFLIKLFDPEIHEEIRTERNSILKTDQIDERWVKIKRPTIIVGGELTMDSLEVRYNATSRISEASTQLKSNLGTLVIDDFGRQRMNPFELLNRWIVPLEQRYDFLALANGQKIQVPFDQLLIFSTNLEPRDLVDEAFLRRIPYKINIIDPTEEEFRDLFRIMCRHLEMEYDDAVVDYLIEQHHRSTGRAFRCCQPRDLLTIIRNQGRYGGRQA
ncbi:MAG TPA: AAA family ATPase, partial [Phycisphaerae bacterium]|nr:AAA family ATPase [Phycisphaerae bacterium]